MAKSHDPLLNHSYDGIQEYDNPLPLWWTWLFYGTIIFAVVYIPYYAVGWGLSTADEYNQEMAAASKGKAAPGQPGGAAPGGQSTTAAAAPSLEGNPEAIAAGQALLATNCSPCHGPQGQGGIGPNLTDEYWLHGHTHGDFVNVITEGVPAKGMIAWKATLNPQKIQQVAAFVGSLKGTNPPNPKAPQGKKITE